LGDEQFIKLASDSLLVFSLSTSFKAFLDTGFSLSLEPLQLETDEISIRAAIFTSSRLSMWIGGGLGVETATIITTPS
jgi:hypothetical protein